MAAVTEVRELANRRGRNRQTRRDVIGLALGLVRSWLLEGHVLDLDQILYENARVKTYWHQREQLYRKEGVLYQRTVVDVKQLVMPKETKGEFMKLAHTGITGGHLGVLRTRWQVQRRA